MSNTIRKYGRGLTWDPTHLIGFYIISVTQIFPKQGMQDIYRPNTFFNAYYSFYFYNFNSLDMCLYKNVIIQVHPCGVLNLYGSDSILT